MSKLTTPAADVSLDYASAADWPSWTDRGYWTPTGPDAFEPTYEDATEAGAVLNAPLLTDEELAGIDARIAENARLGDEYGERFPHLRRSMVVADVAEFLARSRDGHDA